MMKAPGNQHEWCGIPLRTGCASVCLEAGLLLLVYVERDKLAQRFNSEFDFTTL